MIFCLLILLCHYETALGCHWTNIVIRNGTWCCGGEGGQADVGGAVTLPPGVDETTTAPATTDNTTMTTTIDTTTILTTTTNTDTTTGPPQWPVGDCPCGIGVQDIETAISSETTPALPPDFERFRDYINSQYPTDSANLIRPWMVKIYIEREDLENRECSGSLLNKKFVITAAHCFCGTVVRCDGKDFQKIFNSDEEPLLEKVAVSVKYKGEGEDPIMHTVQRLIIHPDYYQTSGETVTGNTDVALIMTHTDVFEIDPDDPYKTNDEMIAPICLPPKLGYNPDDDQSDLGIHEAFEDLDCFIIPDDQMNVPYPYNREDLQMDKRWLSCHPGRLLPSEVNKIGKNSYITGFGSRAREDTHENARFQCTTNSYGPSDSILQRCTSKCYKDIQTTVDVDYDMHTYDDWGQRRQVPYPLTDGNPSMVLKECQDFKRTMLKDALQIHYREMSENDDAFLGWVKIYVLDKEKEILCFPFDVDKQVNSGKNILEYPYSHGWCTVCDEGTIGECLPKPQSGWGFCQPQCDEDSYQNPEDTAIREAIVDSFLYENCSANINIQTEFCTGVPIVGGYGQIWTLENNEYKKIGNELRNFQELVQDANASPSEMKQMIQHTSTLGDVCYGDAGGSVWKYWAFRDGNLGMENRVHKLAVLTGVVSRFEEHCGAVDTGSPQHSTHTRVTKILDWINMWIVEGSCYPSDQEPVFPESEMGYEFENYVEDNFLK